MVTVAISSGVVRLPPTLFYWSLGSSLPDGILPPDGTTYNIFLFHIYFKQRGDSELGLRQCGALALSFFDKDKIGTFRISETKKQEHLEQPTAGSQVASARTGCAARLGFVCSGFTRSRISAGRRRESVERAPDESFDGAVEIWSRRLRSGCRNNRRSPTGQLAVQIVRREYRGTECRRMSNLCWSSVDVDSDPCRLRRRQ